MHPLTAPTTSCRVPAPPPVRGAAACSAGRRTTAVDEDGDLVWDPTPGTLLVPDIAAWDRLGVGGRTETWLGWSVSQWHLVVVKLARPHQVGHPRARLTLQREADALAGDAHPVLPRLLRRGLDAEIPYVVTEFVAGDALDEVAGTAPLDPVSAAVLAMDLLSAASSLHQRQLAHLDIKPENVVLRDHRTVLLDFGSVRTLGSRQPAGRPVGTLGYAAPEMEACAPISAAMDVYGIGATLREALTGLSPYDHDARRRRAALAPLAVAPGEVSVHSLAAAMLADDPRDRPTVPAALAAVAALFDPQSRPWPAWVGAVKRTTG